jgi:hypothetical protein
VTTGTSTSIYANAWRAIYRLLGEESWPDITKPSGFVFGCTYGNTQVPDESVLVVTTPDDDINQMWGPIGELRRDETFTVQILVSTFRPHMTWLKALDRLEQLTSVVEQMIHRTARVQDRASTLPELAGVLKTWSIVRAIPEVLPMSNGKYGAMADIRVLVEARIKPTNPS